MNFIKELIKKRLLLIISSIVIISLGLGLGLGLGLNDNNSSSRPEGPPIPPEPELPELNPEAPTQHETNMDLSDYPSLMDTDLMTFSNGESNYRIQGFYSTATSAIERDLRLAYRYGGTFNSDGIALEIQYPILIDPNNPENVTFNELNYDGDDGISNSNIKFHFWLSNSLSIAVIGSTEELFLYLIYDFNLTYSRSDDLYTPYSEYKDNYCLLISSNNDISNEAQFVSNYCDPSTKTGIALMNTFNGIVNDNFYIYY